MSHARRLTGYLPVLLIPVCLLLALGWNSGQARSLICKE